MTTRITLVLVLLLTLSGCASTPQSAALMQSPPSGLKPRANLDHIPFFPQEQYQCGPAALATMLGASELNITPRELVPLVYVPGRQGSFQVELVAAARSKGRMTYELSPSLESVLTEVSAGNPVLVLQNLGLNWYPQWHFAVIKGYDLNTRTIVLNSGLVEDYQVSLKTFERTWQRAGRWAVLVLQPGQLPETADPDRLFTSLVAFARNNNASDTTEAFEAAIQRWPEHIDLQMGYNNRLYEQGAIDDAAAGFQSLISRHPEYAPAYNNLAQIRFEQGDTGAALKLANQALAIGGEHSRTYQDTLLMIQQSQ